MHLTASGIVCAVRSHGEHGAIVRVMTAHHGMVAGYVRGGRSRTMRPVLIPGNTVAVTLAARTEQQLAGMTVEPAHSLAGLHGEPLAAAAIDWICALGATALPEGQAYPRVHATMEAVLAAVEMAPAARGWAASLARFELLLLQELGFGLDLGRCAATGVVDTLDWVSPRTGQAVSAAEGAAHAHRLLPLPAFLRDGGEADWPDILAGLRVTRHFLERELLTARAGDVLAARDRLVDRIERAVA